MKASLSVLVCTAVFAVCGPAKAFSECVRPIKNLFQSTSSETMFYVTFDDGGSSIFKRDADISAGQMNRLAAMVLMAQSTGRQLTVRYPEDGLACPPTGTARSDFTGAWLK